LGTGLVWLPLSAYLALTGDWANALGLFAYSLLILTNIDNLIRFVLQKKLADTHPLVTIFGVIIGLSLFGFMGIIFGPILLSGFILCFHIFKVEYLEGKPFTGTEEKEGKKETPTSGIDNPGANGAQP
jgi:predicted PurR-regulated permease PerM